CSCVKKVWYDVSMFIKEKVLFNFNLHFENVVFGYFKYDNVDNEVFVINLFILLVKFHIHKCTFSNKNPCFTVFFKELENCLSWQLLCTDHHELFNKFMGTSDNQQKETVDPSEGIKSTPSWSSMPRRSERSTRVRTVLSESQLHMLQTCYRANPRPDALMKEQLVEMTGLSPRVIRVWFQNKRCKDKKRGLMMRSTQQQLEGCLVSEEPLQLDSPERQDSDVLINPPWKLLTDFILQKDAEHRSYPQLLSFSKEVSCSAGSEVVSISAQLADTPSSLTASPADMSE
uniref:Insulin gene enhancer protein ISL-2A-like n=2 Tax=Sinocyclocheilus grahami TaxID=75366 RepID=A0A672KZU7_SINGR